MRYRICLAQLTLVATICATLHPVSAKPAGFVNGGQLLIIDDSSSTTLQLRGSRDQINEHHQVSQYWGSLDDDRLLVTLLPDAARDVAEEQDHHCSSHSAGESAWLVRRNGELETMLCTNVLRAYPAPAGNRVALISPERDLSIWHNDACTTVAAPGRISNAGWSPDGRYLAVSVYPPDWTEGAVSEADTTAEFLRLQNADLYLLDLEQMQFVSQLTADPGTEYGAFFSPDGGSLYYHWLHLTEDEGGLMRLDLDKDGGTSASAPAARLTIAGNDAGETPLGRVSTYVWRDAAQQLVFESGLPDGSGEIWVMSAQGRNATRVAAGRKPQPLGSSAVIFMGHRGVPESYIPEVKP